MSENLVYIDKENTEENVIKKDNVVLLDFFAPWCGPCRMLGPVLDELADKYKGKAVVAKCDTDQYQELAVKFGVRSVPTVIIFKNGEVVDTTVGVKPKDYYVGKLDSLI